jgi:hypothetical protein
MLPFTLGRQFSQSSLIGQETGSLPSDHDIQGGRGTPGSRSGVSYPAAFVAFFFDFADATGFASDLAICFTAAQRLICA